MASESYDLAVIGGGPGGYVAAIRASQLGLKVVLIEKSALGGVCLNWGCIPTKALLRSADVYRTLMRSSDFGINCKGISIDFQAVIERSRAAASQLSQGVRYLLKKNKVAVIEGLAKLAEPHEITVNLPTGAQLSLNAKNIILATGARGRALDAPSEILDRIWGYREALMPPEHPKTLLIVGSGAIGIEFACFYAAMGTQVTLVEMQKAVAPSEDKDISAELEKHLKAQGIEVLTNCSIQSFSLKSKNQVETSLLEGNGEPLLRQTDYVLSAVGIIPNSENIGLDTVGIDVNEQGFVKTDVSGETNIKGVFAIGDLAGGPCLAHKASHEGIMVAEGIAGHVTSQLDPNKIPSCIYGHPNVARIGLTEDQARNQAKDQGRQIQVGRFPFMANGKAIASGDAEGFIKTILDEATGELLGAHMIGPEVTELIQGFSVAMTLEATEAELLETIFPHPTLSEGMLESLLNALNRSLHI